jgi:hypothetical protein
MPDLSVEEGIAIAESIGSDIGKISMDVLRPHPVCGSAFHPEVIALVFGPILRVVSISRFLIDSFLPLEYR